MQELDAPGAPELGTIALASLSDAGRVRSENQDALALLENSLHERLMLVADGMGGHRGGETASRICLQMVERVFREPYGTPEQRLHRSLELANEAIYSHALANQELRGMGTTAVAVLLAPAGGAWVAWVGDSRCYRLRDGALEQLTQDHSLMSEWVSIGVITSLAAKTHPRRHELTRALGQSPDVAIDLLAIDLRPGDRLLLCSDGLHGYVDERAVKLALAAGTPEEAVRALVDAANENGGSDNVSVAVAALSDAPAAVPEISECAPEIAAQLEPLAEPEPQSETSFADLDAEIAEAVAEPTVVGDIPAPEAVPISASETELLPPAAQQIQIPLMMPVRVRRGIDVTSLIVGIAATLVIVGLGFGALRYTGSRSATETAAQPQPRPTVSHATKPAPRPQPVAPAVEKPVQKPIETPRAKPLEKPAASPEIARVPPPQLTKPPIPLAARAENPTPRPPALPSPASVPAAAERPAAEPSPTAAGFELTPDVERFLTEWLGALETDDRARLEALGFSDEPAAFAGTAGSRDSFRLVVAEIDEERSRAGRVYLRLIVSYAFRDATGRFRTQDEQRLILHEVAGRLRFEGRWQ